MNKPIYIKLFFLLFFFFGKTITIHSQNFDTRINLSDTTQIHIIQLKNGKKLRGRILQIQNEKVFFKPKKESESTTLFLSEIREIKVSGHLDFFAKKYDDPLEFSQYLFFTNTAFSLRQGRSSYRTFLGASILYEYGVLDGLSFGFGYGFPFQFFGHLKFSGQLNKNYRLAYKSLLLNLPDFFDNDFKLLIFENTLVQSFGTPDRFFNISYSNYWIKDEDFFFGQSDFPTIYNSFSLGGGIRMNENIQLIVENHVNFNSNFLEAKVLPSFGLSYTTPKFNVTIGFQSSNQSGFNFFPILDFSEDNVAEFTNTFFGKIPFFTYSRMY